MRDTGCEVRDVRERWAGHVARVPHPASRIWEEATRVIGCQDFCGHYDWTFEYLRREFGEEAFRVERLGQSGEQERKLQATGAA